MNEVERKSKPGFATTLKENKDLVAWIVFSAIGTVALFLLAWYVFAPLLEGGFWAPIIVTEIGIGASIGYLYSGANRKKSYWIFIIIANICSGIYSLSLGYTITFLTYYLYYMPIELAGYGFWRRHTVKDGKIETKTLEKKERLILYVLLGMAVFQFALFLGILEMNNLIYQEQLGFWAYWYPILDSYRNLVGIVAMYLTLRRYSETWELWFSVALISLVMYITSLISYQPGDDSRRDIISFYILTSEWAVYTIFKSSMNIYGRINWAKHASKKEATT